MLSRYHQQGKYWYECRLSRLDLLAMIVREDRLHSGESLLTHLHWFRNQGGLCRGDFPLSYFAAFRGFTYHARGIQWPPSRGTLGVLLPSE